ncbi:3-oxoacyl-[acyl-carrier protein] reductase [Halobacillus alkaliphilus]|uniref:3-oxoacyl-[acyl-carrier protein] reductase n=1 Tax=Halobacillus alkaliphilus TaxID=396056 RepID=A0A1I2Q0U1_9BACI|nr:SDR family oxidoreductase [Halobacillus alkaliphilus]SFG19241.1 3-oxoacyl-[acyl-carrier protein] reductase [Halobacillus alkaliphilus]
MSVFSNDALIGEHILITGATGGIGYEAAKEAVRTGAHITITGRNEEKLEALKEECKRLNSEVEVLVGPADINMEDDRKQLVRNAKESIGPITGLVNSAGIGGGAPLEDLTEEQLRKPMELNYFSTVLLTQEVYKDMKQQRRGAIVNLSSLSGLRGTHSNIAYSSSKFAVIGFTQSLAIEAIEYNVRVNAICPGFVDTSMGRQAIANIGKREGRSYEKQRQLSEEALPSGRISTPEEVARSIVYLLTDACENIVGESLKISGGGVMR